MKTQLDKIIKDIKESQKTFPDKALNKYKIQFVNALKKYGEIHVSIMDKEDFGLWSCDDHGDIIKVSEEKTYNSYNDDLLLTWVVKPVRLTYYDYTQEEYEGSNRYPFTLFAMHLHGDVRANYSTCAILPYNVDRLFSILMDDEDFKYFIKSPNGFSLWHEPTQLSGHIMYSTAEELEEISLCSSKQDLLDKGLPNKVLRAIKNDPLLGSYCNF